MEFDENLNPIEDRTSGGQNTNPASGGEQTPRPAQPTWSQTPSASQPTYTQPPVKQTVPTSSRGGMSTGILTLLIIVFVGLIGIAMTAIATGDTSASSDNYLDGITVSGEGVVYATPDIAKLDFGVTESAKDIDDVREEIDNRIDKILDALDEFNIDDDDIKTVDYNLYPESDYRYSPARITGYTGRHTFTLTIRDLDDVNDIVDTVTKAGANEVGNIFFTVEDPNEWVEDARKDAIDEARDMAKSIAKSADVKLGKLLSIQENVGNPYDTRYDYGYGYGGGEEVKISPNIEPGSQEIRVSVTLRYKLG
ncbi:MAG: SIMPL domain-containing protein [Patescibacteria group bacterium]|nr:SIMPL domain-containing protein [Patescibacteria group bacterium]